MNPITQGIRDAHPRYMEDTEYGRVFNLSRYCAERHWPPPLAINGHAYRQRSRKRRAA